MWWWWVAKVVSRQPYAAYIRMVTNSINIIRRNINSLHFIIIEYLFMLKINPSPHPSATERVKKINKQQQQLTAFNKHTRNPNWLK